MGKRETSGRVRGGGGGGETGLKCWERFMMFLIATSKGGEKKRKREERASSKEFPKCLPAPSKAGTGRRGMEEEPGTIC